MKNVLINDFYNEFCQALTWAKKLVPEISKKSRFYDYEKELRRLFDCFQTGERPGEFETKASVEAHIEGLALVDIHKKFKDRNDFEFRNKIKQMFFGPYYSSDEKNGGSVYQKGLARDIQSELILASRFKNQKLGCFSESDFSYVFNGVRVGFECKRVHSEESVVKLFTKACKKIQKNLNAYGIVGLRLDKCSFVNRVGKIHLPQPILRKREPVIGWVQNNDDVHRALAEQMLLFHKSYQEIFRQIIKGSGMTKVLGYCVLLYLPSWVGNPLKMASNGVAEFTSWYKSDEPMREEISKCITPELESH